MRWIEPMALAALSNRRLTRVRVALGQVLDLRDPSVLGLTLATMTDDYDYMITQEIAAAALRLGIEGLLVPSASLVGDNLVVLVGNLAPTSRVDPLDWVDPRLYVPRPPSV